VYVSQLDVDAAETMLVVVLAGLRDARVRVVDVIVALEDSVLRALVEMEPECPLLFCV
jgi:hypothetical protein